MEGSWRQPPNCSKWLCHLEQCLYLRLLRSNKLKSMPAAFHAKQPGMQSEPVLS
ncbi:hypothetical protein [Lapidilactobacillus wuchangensis]|uniref:hypothetical protein n=1 Tax=Lapidilactobacillus wuchangensis TaxID=2486001 RepID=UPI0013DD91A4|nr:hypothetical protein [Lapidilactobacillus wuchangensis]